MTYDLSSPSGRTREGPPPLRASAGEARAEEPEPPFARCRVGGAKGTARVEQGPDHRRERRRQHVRLAARVCLLLRGRPRLQRRAGRADIRPMRGPVGAGAGEHLGRLVPGGGGAVATSVSSTAARRWPIRAVTRTLETTTCRAGACRRARDQEPPAARCCAARSVSVFSVSSKRPSRSAWRRNCTSSTRISRGVGCCANCAATASANASSGI
jgi:hypothetical protein